MVRRMSLFAAVALFVGVISARAEERKPAEQPFDDQTFVKTAGSSGMAEVELAKIAVEKAKNADVKKFAEMMVKDHGKANDELKAAAKAANIEVPNQLSDKHQKHLDMFKDYKGTDFDKDYIKHMVGSHTDGVALFTQASKEAKNKELKEFATRTLPVVQKHLEEAKKLDK